MGGNIMKGRWYGLKFLIFLQFIHCTIHKLFMVVDSADEQRPDLYFTIPSNSKPKADSLDPHVGIRY